MTAPADPLIEVRALSQAIGIPPHDIWRWQSAGFIPRPRKGHAPLLGTLRGAIDALRAEAADPAPYTIPAAAAAPVALPGTVALDDAEAALRRLSARAEADLARLLQDRAKPLKGQTTRQAANVRARISAADRAARALWRNAAILLEDGEAL